MSIRSTHAQKSDKELNQLCSVWRDEQQFVLLKGRDNEATPLPDNGHTTTHSSTHKANPL